MVDNAINDVHARKEDLSNRYLRFPRNVTRLDQFVVKHWIKGDPNPYTETADNLHYGDRQDGTDERDPFWKKLGMTHPFEEVQAYSLSRGMHLVDLSRSLDEVKFVIGRTVPSARLERGGKSTNAWHGLDKPLANATVAKPEFVMRTEDFPGIVGHAYS